MIEQTDSFAFTNSPGKLPLPKMQPWLNAELIQFPDKTETDKTGKERKRETKENAVFNKQYFFGLPLPFFPCNQQCSH